MDQFNKAISFILGLVVVAVFIAVASGRINLKSKLPFLTQQKVTASPTKIPTPTVKPKQSQSNWLSTLFGFGKQKPTATPIPQKTNVQPTAIPETESGEVTLQNETNNASSDSQNTYRRYNNVTNVTTIPNTGPSIILPLIVTSFMSGIYFSQKGKK